MTNERIHTRDRAWIQLNVGLRIKLNVILQLLTFRIVLVGLLSHPLSISLVYLKEVAELQRAVTPKPNHLSM